ncbi:MAG: alpha/beta hydrolase [Planctomycetota bacterium]
MTGSSLTKLPLWPDTPGPTLTLHPTTAAPPRGAVMVIPGSGYHQLAEHEGTPVAERLAQAGFDAAVLRHRVHPDRHPAMIHDAQRGIRLMRCHSAIRAERYASLGFSAGGHLASTLAVHPERFVCPEDDLADAVPARPDAVVLAYPVIDLAGDAAHAGSRLGLLGDDPDPDDLALLCTHRHVQADTPPAFIWHGLLDCGVPPENALLYATACRRAGVPFDLHLYERADHGVGLAEQQPEVARWFDDCVLFLGRHLGQI